VYTYVGNNPVNFIDPSGEWRIPESVARWVRPIVVTWKMLVSKNPSMSTIPTELEMMQKVKQIQQVKSVKPPISGPPSGGANAAAIVCLINPDLCNQAAQQLACVIKNQPPPVPPGMEGNCHWEADGWRSWRLVCWY
jgi:hypothetical protein